MNRSHDVADDKDHHCDTPTTRITIIRIIIIIITLIYVYYCSLQIKTSNKNLKNTHTYIQMRIIIKLLQLSLQ